MQLSGLPPSRRSPPGGIAWRAGGDRQRTNVKLHWPRPTPRPIKYCTVQFLAAIRADFAQAGSPTNTGKIGDILDQLGQGFYADDATNLEKLNIARTYGAKLLELKALVPHGKFQETLAGRFPSVNYSKCNRWMGIAREASRVADATEKYPDIAWGPKKMIDFLTGSWRPRGGRCRGR